MTSIHTRNMHIFLIVSEMKIIHKSIFNFLSIFIHSTIFYDRIEANSTTKVYICPQSTKLNWKIMCKTVNQVISFDK
jgi:hypothetical protein